MKHIQQSVIAAFVAAILVSSLTGCKKEGSDDGSRSLSLSENSIELSQDQSRVLYATIRPTTATVLWSSADDKIATVSQDGLVTAVCEKGETQIWALHGNDYNVMACCRVVVNTVFVDEIQLPSSLPMVIGETLQLTPVIKPEVAKNAPLSYEVTSGKSYVSVSPEGLLKALSVGTATVTVTAQDNHHASASMTVNVQAEPIWPTSVRLEYNAEVVQGNVQRAQVIYDPLTANRKYAELVAENPSLASIRKISDDEFEITAGTVASAYESTTLTLTWQKSQGVQGTPIKAAFYVHRDPPSIQIDESTRNALQYGLVAGGGVVHLYATVQGLSNTGVEWSSSDETVAQISSDKWGRPTVVPRSYGWAELTATAVGNSSVSVTTDKIQVYGAPASIESNPDGNLFIRYGQSASRNFVVKDAQGRKSLQQAKVTITGNTISTDVVNYNQDKGVQVTFTSNRSSASSTLAYTATLQAGDFTKEITVLDAMYDNYDIKPYDGIKFVNGSLKFVDGGYRGSGYFDRMPTKYSFQDCKGLVVWTGSRSSLNIPKSRLRVDGQHITSVRPLVNGFALAWKNAYVPSGDSDNKGHWQRNHTTVNGYDPYYTQAPIWNGGDWLYTGNTYPYGYEITQAEMNYNNNRSDDYDIWPVRHLSNYEVTPPAAPETSGWYVPTSGEWYLMLSNLGPDSTTNQAAAKVSEYLSLMSGGEPIIANGVAQWFWSCQEGSTAETKAVYMTSISATPAGTTPEKTTDKKSSVARTRAFFAF